MSKAFLRESDLDDDDPIVRRVASLPPGAKNLITEEGERRLREQLAELQAKRRPLSRDSDAEERRQLQALDQRIRHFEESVRTASVVPAPPKPWDTVRFGATVTTKETSGAHSQYRLVGADEADPARGWVSWQSPIARALLNATLGSTVTFAFPSGRATLEVVEITY